MKRLFRHLQHQDAYMGFNWGLGVKLSPNRRSTQGASLREHKFIMIGESFESALLWWNLSSLVLAALNFTSKSFPNWATRARSEGRWSARFQIFGGAPWNCCIIRMINDVSVILDRWLIYSRKRLKPRKEQCGTPAWTVWVPIDWPLTMAFSPLHIKKDLIIERALPESLSL